MELQCSSTSSSLFLHDSSCAITGVGFFDLAALHVMAGILDWLPSLPSSARWVVAHSVPLRQVFFIKRYTLAHLIYVQSLVVGSHLHTYLLFSQHR